MLPQFTQRLVAICAVLLVVVTSANAQPQTPARLAIVSLTNSIEDFSTLLTAKLSSHSEIHLVERDEIARAYQEQSLANQNHLQLGKMLGADGLLLFNVTTRNRSTNLTMRLVAVKPGIILSDEEFGWPLNDVQQLSDVIERRLAFVLLKLPVAPKDAIPISIVNFRSPVKTAESEDTQQLLQLLAIERLSREPRLFVTERQKLALASEEKSLGGDGSAFWGGAWLLDGVVDENGYSKETITINARLTPAKGGAAFDFQLSGSRTNLPGIITSLAARMTEALQTKPSSSPWNAAEESAKFLDEAKWDFKWKSYAAAKEAADSAWALGNQDIDCGVLRVRAAVADTTTWLTPFDTLESTELAKHPLKLRPPRKDKQPPIGWAYSIQSRGDRRIVNYVSLNTPPELANIDRATQLLAVYEQLSHQFPETVMTTAKVNSGWKNSDWYNAGVQAVSVASEVLENFHLAPELREQQAEKLANLRAHVRAVSEWIMQVPAVRDSYFVDGRIANHDELANSLETATNIFVCSLRHAAFWCEKPQDVLAAYRKLLGSSAFSYIHQDLWGRDLQRPRLVTWMGTNDAILQNSWSNFVGELTTSTNLLWRLEAKALALADAKTDSEVGEAFTNLFTALIENGDTLAANPVEVLYANWGVGALMSPIESGLVTPLGEALGRQYRSLYAPKLQQFDRVYWDKTLRNARASAETTSSFEEQKKYLKENHPYDFFEFAKLFRNRDFTRAQAEELLPLVRSYQSNLTAIAQSNVANKDRMKARSGAGQAALLERSIDRILNPPSAPIAQQSSTMPKPAATVTAQSAGGSKSPSDRQSIPLPKPVIPVSQLAPASVPELVTNVLTISKFLPIPLAQLTDAQINGACILSHQWLENKLVLDFQFSMWTGVWDANSNLVSGREIKPYGVAVLDVPTERWQVIACPLMSAKSKFAYSFHNYYGSTLFNGDVYISYDGKIQMFEKGNKWHVLEISDGNNYQLFAVNGHLYAADSTVIFEIIDGGKATKLLASAKRRPPVTALDSVELGKPILFSGPNGSLRTSAAGKLFTWTGSDWRDDGKLTLAQSPEIMPEGVLFCTGGMSEQSKISYIANTSAAPELFFESRTGRTSFPGFGSGSRPPTQAADDSHGLWPMPDSLRIANLPQAVRGRDTYFLIDHSTTQNVVSNQVIVERKILTKDGCHAKLLHFVPGENAPRAQYLKFDAPKACPLISSGGGPAVGMPGFAKSEWIMFADDLLLLGTENTMGVASGASHMACPPGVWVSPASEIQ